MSDGCTREADVLEASRSTRWSQDLQQHAADCADCQEVVFVAGLLRREATLAEAECREGALILDADLAWLQADVARRRAEAAGLARRLRQAEQVAMGAGVLGIAALTVAGRGMIGSLLVAGRGGVNELVSAARSADPSSAALSVLIALAAMSIIAFHNLWVDQT